MAEPDVAPALIAAAAAVAEARWEDAATSLIAAWHLARAARIARLVAAVDLRLPPPAPLDADTVARREKHWHELVGEGGEANLRRALAADWPAHANQAQVRVEALGGQTSPRISNELLALHRRAPWGNRTSANQLTRAIFRLLIDMDDEAVVDEMARMKSVPTEAARIGRGMFRRKLPRGTELSPAAIDALERIEHVLAGRHATRTPREALLAAVYESPDDDGPRLVYADVLSEAGDPRGEFITLQLKRARDGTSIQRREKQLLRDARRQWFDGLDQDGATSIELARGFPVSATVRSGALKAAAWATIETLILEGDAPFVDAKHLRALRRLARLSGRDLSAIELARPELEYLSLASYSGRLDDAATALAPRILGLQPPWHPQTIFEVATQALAGPIGRRVEVLRLCLQTRGLEPAIAFATGTNKVVELFTNLEVPEHWTVRIAADQLDLHWTGTVRSFDQGYHTILPVLEALSPPTFRVVRVTGLNPDQPAIRKGLLRTFARWPSLEVQELDGES